MVSKTEKEVPLYLKTNMKGVSNSWVWNICIKQGVNIVLEKPFLLLCSPWPNLKGREELFWQLCSSGRHYFKHCAITFLLHFLVWLSCLCYLGICSQIHEATSWIFRNKVQRDTKNISGLLLSNKNSKICQYHKVLIAQTMTEHGNKTGGSTFAKQAVLHWSDFVKRRKCHLK